jgi:hypothetical protein
MNAEDNPHLPGRHVAVGERQSKMQTDDDPDRVDFPPTNEADYKSYARAWNKPVRAIHFFTQNGQCRTFEYADLRSRCGSDEDFENTRFKLTFLGMRAVEVVVEGRDLWLLYDYIHMVAARDFAKTGDRIVTRVTFTNLKADEGKATRRGGHHRPVRAI